MIWKAAERRKVPGRALDRNCKEGELLLFKVLLAQLDPSNVEVLVCIGLLLVPQHLILGWLFMPVASFTMGDENGVGFR